MGMFDEIAKGVMGQLAGSGQQSAGSSQLLSVALQFLQNHPGGLNAVLQQFNGAGLAKEVQSWIGTGQNLPISPEQLGQVFGAGQIGKIASQLGMGQSEVTSGLANLLPQLVDKLSPTGSLPQHAALQDGLSQIMGMFGK